MGRKCAVKGCPTGYKAGSSGVPLFTCPTKDLLPAWQAAVPRRDTIRIKANPPLTMQSTVCAKHFLPTDILTHDTTVTPDGKTVVTRRYRPGIKKTAVPCRFGAHADYEPPTPPLNTQPPPARTPVAVMSPPSPMMPEGLLSPSPTASVARPPMVESPLAAPLMSPPPQPGASSTPARPPIAASLMPPPPSFTSPSPPLAAPLMSPPPQPGASSTPARPPIAASLMPPPPSFPSPSPPAPQPFQYVSSPETPQKFSQSRLVARQLDLDSGWPGQPSDQSTPIAQQQNIEESRCSTVASLYSTPTSMTDVSRNPILNQSSVYFPDVMEASLQETATKKVIHSVTESYKLPGPFWGVHTDGENKTAFTVLDQKLMRNEKGVIFTSSFKPLVIVQKTVIDMPEVNTRQGIENLLRKVHCLKACVGHTDENARRKEWSYGCKGFVESRRAVRCVMCSKTRKQIIKQKQMKPKKAPIQERLKAAQIKIKNFAKKTTRLTKKVDSLRKQVNETMKNMNKIKAESIEKILQLLPEEQKSLVRACFEAAKHHNNKNRRYTTDWVYDCIIMRIKAPALYEKLRVENKLALPSPRTLNRYMASLRPAYGFQENVFNVMKEKSNYMSKGECHGCILLDEMALESRTYFDKNSCEVKGLVDLGGFEDESDKDKRGDHALVIVFQPFKGKWVQAIGAFLSAGAVTSPKLHKLILEAIALLEKSGYYVDCVVTDAATWNRSMWDLFGISANRPSCEHPVDPKRELRFASDFPHLIKSLWTRIINKKTLLLPEGRIDLRHWWIVLEQDEKVGVKSAFALQRDHLEPTNFQKMKVRLAMQFFGGKVAAAMKHHMNKGVRGLEDAGPTVAFIERINAVVDAMNSQLPWQALKPDPDSNHHKVLIDFLTYLDKMNELARTKYEKTRAIQLSLKKRVRAKKEGTPYIKYDDEITTSAWLGLQVTIQNALSLVGYLSEECNFLYLMTRRINQDSLEHFFGHIRGACGANTHPDPRMFVNVYRLLMTYSLIKPPRGSNVSGGEVLDAMAKLKDCVGEQNLKKRQDLEEAIDNLLDSDIIIPENSELDPEEYLTAPIDPYALTVFGGYVARKIRGMNPASNCQTCTNALCLFDQPLLEREALLQIRTRGGLVRPTNALQALLGQLENAVMTVTSGVSLHSSVLFTVLDELLSSNVNLQLIGCADHARGVTSAIISFYLTTRMHFACAENDRKQKVADKNRRKRDLAKTAKLSD